MISKVNPQLDLFPEWQLNGEKYILTEIWFQFYDCIVSCDRKKHWTNSWTTGRLLSSGIDCNCQEIKNESL